MTNPDEHRDLMRRALENMGLTYTLAGWVDADRRVVICLDEDGRGPGPDDDAVIAACVRWMAERGVLSLTLASGKRALVGFDGEAVARDYRTGSLGLALLKSVDAVEAMR